MRVHGPGWREAGLKRERGMKKQHEKQGKSEKVNEAAAGFYSFM